jgi:hypothetical protein
MRSNIVRHSAAVASMALVLGSALPAAAAATAQVHQHEGAATQELKLDAGKKWETDAPLRKGMSEIRNAIVADKSAIHAGKLSDARYDALAKRVDAQVAYMIANCKLRPEADAQLHLVIAQIVEGSEAMKGKAKGATRRAGAEKIVAALNAYGNHFEHPGWTSLTG